jgi:hypothetical protein
MATKLYPCCLGCGVEFKTKGPLLRHYKKCPLKLQLLAHSNPDFPDRILTLPIEESGFANDLEMPAPLSPEPDLDLNTSHAVRYIQILTLWYCNLTTLMQPSVQTLVASHLGREELLPSRSGHRRFAPRNLYVDNATTSSSGAARLGQLSNDPAPVASRDPAVWSGLVFRQFAKTKDQTKRSSPVLGYCGDWTAQRPRPWSGPGL